MKRQILTACCFLVLAMLACTLPSNGPRSLTEPTPNETMTALFGSGVLGTLTAEAKQVDLPSATLPAATATLAPTETTTPTAIPATATSEPATNTPPPTITSAPLPSRGSVVYAPYYYGQPTLDGVWDDFNTTTYEANFVTYGAGNRVDANDLGANYRIAWDEDFLYIAVKIGDDVYAQNASGANLYEGDSLEILLDSDLYFDFNTASLTSDDFQLGISPGNPDVNGTREAFLWFPRNLAGARSNVQVASVRESGVTRMEVFIPWSVLGVNPSVNRHLGFALSVSDNDNTGQNTQQSMVSSAYNRHLTNPTTWGELVLTN